MNPILRNIIAVIAGLLIGLAVNKGIVTISGSVVPLPEGVDPSDMDSLKKNMHLFEDHHFIMPFLAHALGTFSGALVAVLIAVSRKMIFALSIGAVFLIGGVIMSYKLPAPSWFIAVDIIAAYIPMAWLGGMLGKKIG